VSDTTETGFLEGIDRPGEEVRRDPQVDLDHVDLSRFPAATGDVLRRMFSDAVTAAERFDNSIDLADLPGVIAAQMTATYGTATGRRPINARDALLHLEECDDPNYDEWRHRVDHELVRIVMDTAAQMASSMTMRLREEKSRIFADRGNIRARAARLKVQLDEAKNTARLLRTELAHAEARARVGGMRELADILDAESGGAPREMTSSRIVEYIRARADRVEAEGQIDDTAVRP
jgi:hypothetical protein